MNDGKTYWDAEAEAEAKQHKQDRPIGEQLIRARFKGKLPSLGYWPKQTYVLKTFTGRMYKGKEMFAWIEREDGNGKCPYESRESFEENWEIL